mmetsp:Transcript_178082/g.565234  ORF Transcript_178082/g.565234 Transcript_178082/m.565234 type:complete len:206 (+) Transcript_178082:464-1081(+)
MPSRSRRPTADPSARRGAVKKMSQGALVPNCSSKLTVLRLEDEHAVARAEDNCDPTGVIVPALQTAEVAELSVRASSTSELLSLSLSLSLLLLLSSSLIEPLLALCLIGWLDDTAEAAEVGRCTRRPATVGFVLAVMVRGIDGGRGTNGGSGFGIGASSCLSHSNTEAGSGLAESSAMMAWSTAREPPLAPEEPCSPPTECELAP